MLAVLAVQGCRECRGFWVLPAGAGGGNGGMLGMAVTEGAVVTTRFRRGAGGGAEWGQQVATGLAVAVALQAPEASGGDGGAGAAGLQEPTSTARHTVGGSGGNGALWQ